jgi:2-deoxy-D-gluconate 3-dehydrogenase
VTAFDLHGKVAVVTGGNGGIGLAIARAYASAGAQVVIAARDQAKSEAARTLIGDSATCISYDLEETDAAQRLADAVASQFGRCDILVANAGLNIRKAPEQLTAEEWNTVIHTNLSGAFLTCQALYPIMRTSGGGKIVCIGSMYSLFGAPLVVAYAASKGGLVQMAKALACAWAADNIQVNTILPGWVETALTDRARADVPGLNDSVLARTPAGRWGVPDDIAGPALFLASAASDFVTGAVLPVDGGFSARG